jgi:glycerophosphoryl diester phosphodiesterase
VGTQVACARPHHAWQDGEIVQQRLPSLLAEPITFAHRGARANHPENTLAAFQFALERGATGLESDVWLTADGVPVLVHDGVLGKMRKRRIAELRRDELPAHIPSLADLLTECGMGYHLSLDLKDADAGRPVIATIAAIAPELLPHTWLCHPDVDVLTDLRPVDGGVHLINSTRLQRLTEGPERRAARLAEAAIDGVNLRKDDWNGGLVTLFHRFERVAFSWDLQFEHELRPAFRMGVDGVYSDHVDRMMEAYRAEVG